MLVIKLYMHNIAPTTFLLGRKTEMVELKNVYNFDTSCSPSVQRTTIGHEFPEKKKNWEKSRAPFGSSGQIRCKTNEQRYLFEGIRNERAIASSNILMWVITVIVLCTSLRNVFLTILVALITLLFPRFFLFLFSFTPARISAEIFDAANIFRPPCGFNLHTSAENE